MKQLWLWQKLGVVAFWLTWPALWLYLIGSTRSRVLIICGDEMLVLRGWLGPGDWDVPGGGLHKGELPVAGAIREVQEETGIKLKTSQLTELGSGQISKYGFRYKYKSFAVVLPKKPITKSQQMEIADLRWISMSDSHQEVLSTDTQLVLSQWQQRR